MKKILLVLITFNVWLQAELSRAINGIVTDSQTGLQWQDDYSDNGGNIKSATWKGAITYCEEEVILGGHNDWRLPNKNELLSIVDYTRHNPAINTMAFEQTASSYYWSSTTTANGTNYAWRVYFHYGYTADNEKTYYNYVRCVRNK